jgi:hypothetical protein
MSLLDGLTGDAATMIDAARRLQSVAAVAHDLIEQARRELDLVQYEGPAAMGRSSPHVWPADCLKTVILLASFSPIAGTR